MRTVKITNTVVNTMMMCSCDFMQMCEMTVNSCARYDA